MADRLTKTGHTDRATIHRHQFDETQTGMGCLSPKSPPKSARAIRDSETTFGAQGTERTHVQKVQIGVVNNLGLDEVDQTV